MANEPDGTEDRQRATRHLAQAERRLADALRLLHAVRRDTLRGRSLPEAFVRARLAYRAAEAEAAGARLRAVSPTPDSTEPVHPTDLTVAFEPTNRHQFVRWLYRAGRISDRA
jgi:hypothetical protein